MSDAANCFCDTFCTFYGDCCSDYAATVSTGCDFPFMVYIYMHFSIY